MGAAPMEVYMDMQMAMQMAMDMGMDWAAVEAEAEITGTPAICVVCMAAAEAAVEAGMTPPPECAGGCMLDGGDGPDRPAPALPTGIDMDMAARYWWAVGMEAPGDTVDDVRRWAATPDGASELADWISAEVDAGADAASMMAAIEAVGA